MKFNKNDRNGACSIAEAVTRSDPVSIRPVILTGCVQRQEEIFWRKHMTKGEGVIGDHDAIGEEILIIIMSFYKLTRRLIKMLAAVARLNTELSAYINKNLNITSSTGRGASLPINSDTKAGEGVCQLVGVLESQIKEAKSSRSASVTAGGLLANNVVTMQKVKIALEVLKEANKLISGYQLNDAAHKKLRIAQKITKALEDGMKKNTRASEGQDNEGKLGSALTDNYNAWVGIIEELQKQVDEEPVPVPEETSCFDSMCKIC